MAKLHSIEVFQVTSGPWYWRKTEYDMVLNGYFLGSFASREKATFLCQQIKFAIDQGPQSGGEGVEEAPDRLSSVLKDLKGG